MIKILQEGRFYGAKGFDFVLLKKVLTEVVKEDFVFFADKLRGIMVAMPPCPTADWQKHPIRSQFNKQGGWYETNLEEFF